MNNPSDLFSRSPENAVINLDNPYITIGHLMCAANEIPLSIGDRKHFTEGLVDAVDELSQNRLIKKTENGWIYSGKPRPEARVKLNSISDETVKVYLGSKILETMDITQAYREAHEGAVLLHQGEPYKVTSFDPNTLEARVEETDEGYYTEALKTIDIYVNEKITEQNHGIPSGLAKVNVTENYNEYRIMHYEKQIDRRPLDLPPLYFPSIGFWFTIPANIASRVTGAGLDLAGGIHAIEHAMIAVSPLHAMCDPRDLGGVSTPIHRDTGGPTIFVYDGYKGGIGLAEKLYSLLPELLETTLNLIQGCKCEKGCPSCIYSSKCGNNNEPLDKQTAVTILRELVSEIKK
jgi:DEAD/DEAH box helicase domain-containing protein